MAGGEKAKRKALHRGLDDIINRDASLTSRLLGRVQPGTREPLPLATEGAAANTETPSATTASVGPSSGAGKEEKATPRRGREEALRAVPDAEPRPQRAVQSITKTDARSQSRAAPADSLTIISLEEFVARWGTLLSFGRRAGKLRICEVLYANTYAVGTQSFFTSYEKLGRLSGMEKKQCSKNIKQLESLGFVERINIFNTATKQGTEFKLHLNPLPPGERRSPNYYCYDEEIP